LATVRGADRARRPIDPVAQAEEASILALERGSRDEDVRRMLTDFRRRLSREPLDTRSRVVYASLLLGLSRNVADMQAAVFHAGTAAELSPVTVPVVRTAALILARANERPRAAALVREMFSYDPPAAAELLGAMEPYLYVHEIEEALPPTVDAWLEWARWLRARGRSEQADRRVRDALARWPDDVRVLSRICLWMAWRGEWDVLAGLIPPSRALVEGPEAAAALICRAHARAASGDADGARADLATALGFDGDQVWAQMAAGDVHLLLGDLEQARRSWTRLLHLLPEESGARRVALLLRLARLEREHGEPAAALRYWRAVLEIDPDHREARRGIEELTGSPP
jgi:tetratricopeptide (TPR) repeat protein